MIDNSPADHSPVDASADVAVVLFRPDPAQFLPLLDAIEAGGERAHYFLNGPIDPSLEARLALSPGAALLGADRNVGQAAGLNALARAATARGARRLLLLDQDSAAPPGLAGRLEQVWAREGAGRNLAAIGPLLTPPEGEGYRPLRYDWRAGPAGPLAEVDFLPTSGSLLDLAAFAQIGPFREDFFIGGVDVEWGWRARAAGYGSAVAREVAMAHRWGEPAAVQGAGPPQILRQPRQRNYYYLRNAAYSLRLPHMPARWRLAMAARMAGQIGLLLARGADRRRDALAARRALADGWRGRLGPIAPELAARL